MNPDFNFADDIELLRHLRSLSFADIAHGCGLSEKTLMRWRNEGANPDWSSLDAFYQYAFELGVEINRIKSDLHSERLGAEGKLALFHGSREGIGGVLSIGKCNPHSDFGKGFYCGESLEQSSLFVANHPKSTLCIIGFDPCGLRCERYSVTQDWMLTIAAFRGKLDGYAEHSRIMHLVSKVRNSDYVIAPIADNRMYEIIDEFLDGLTTDVVCEHCLSATQLGNQYVFVSERSLAQVQIMEQCFLSRGERARYVQRRRTDLKIGEDKVKAAKRLHRGDGRYIDEILS